MKFYKEFTVTAEPFNPELLSGILWELEISGINEEVNSLKVFAEEGYSASKNDISAQLDKLVEQELIRKYSIEENTFEEKNWNEEWEKSLNVIKVSSRIVIKPSFRDYNSQEGEIVITIDPKMSFGTGEHQTTRLVLNYLERYIKPGIKILDVGSGTGILAIASIKLGADSAVAIDNDEWCFSNGVENSEINGVKDRIATRLGVVKDVHEKNFDIITANIQKNILMDIAGDIAERIENEGVLILSGLLESDEEDIKKRYAEHGFKHIETGKLDAWIGLVFKH